MLPLAIAITSGMKELIVWVVLVVAGIIITAIVLSIVQGFRSDLRYIEMEIGRTDGREKAHWERRRRELWLSLIPFYRPRRRKRHHDDHHHHH